MTDAFPTGTRTVVLLAAGALLGAGVTDALATLGGTVPVAWWAARATGLAAYATLWLSALIGLGIGARVPGLHPGTLLALHHRHALASVLLTIVHVLVVVTDAASPIGVAAVVPFAAPVLTGPVALGTIAAWGVGAIVASTALASRLGTTAWRAVHAGAYGVLVLALVHGVTAGTDAGAPAVRAFYAVSVLWMLAAIAVRGAGSRRRDPRAGVVGRARSEAASEVATRR